MIEKTWTNEVLDKEVVMDNKDDIIIEFKHAIETMIKERIEKRFDYHTEEFKKKSEDIRI